MLSEAKHLLYLTEKRDPSRSTLRPQPLCESALFASWGERAQDDVAQGLFNNLLEVNGLKSHRELNRRIKWKNTFTF